jgi:hypothetical protein
MKKCKCCHVFITDDDFKAKSLRDQTLSYVPEDRDIFVYSAVFDVGRSDITRERLVAFDEKKGHRQRGMRNCEASGSSSKELETEKD